MDLLFQLTAKDVLISSLKSSLSKVQEECQLLQHALQDATSESRPSSVLPRSFITAINKHCILDQHLSVTDIPNVDVFHMRLGILSRRTAYNSLKVTSNRQAAGVLIKTTLYFLQSRLLTFYTTMTILLATFP